MNPLIAARFERERQEKEKLFKEIAYGNLPIPVQKIIFEKAWELGHSGGASEVELFYNDLTELQEKIQAWYKEFEDTCKQMEKASNLWNNND